MSFRHQKYRHPERSEGSAFRQQGQDSFRKRVLLLTTAASLLLATPVHAHVGSKDVFETITAGPYKLFVTVRPPTIIPGVATVEVRSYGAPVGSLTDTPMLLTGEASKHPPTPDTMTRSQADSQFFTGQLWIMESGSWQVRFGINGTQRYLSPQLQRRC